MQRDAVGRVSMEEGGEGGLFVGLFTMTTDPWQQTRALLPLFLLASDRSQPAIQH